MINITNDCYQEIKVDELLFEPKTECVVTDVFGKTFMSVKQSPNVFVIKSKDVINTKFVKFTHDNVSYILSDVNIDTNGDLLYLECRYWSIDY